ncbi:hypothetical protein D3C81_1286080 [compost metagenome]
MGNRPDRNNCGTIMRGMNWIICSSLFAYAEMSVPKVKALKDMSKVSRMTRPKDPTIMIPRT